MDEIPVKIGEVELKARRKVFKTGRTGYGCYGKVVLNGEVYQLSLNLIKL